MMLAATQNQVELQILNWMNKCNLNKLKICWLSIKQLNCHSNGIFIQNNISNKKKAADNKSCVDEKDSKIYLNEAKKITTRIIFAMKICLSQTTQCCYNNGWINNNGMYFNTDTHQAFAGHPSLGSRLTEASSDEPMLSSCCLFIFSVDSSFNMTLTHKKSVVFSFTFRS